MEQVCFALNVTCSRILQRHRKTTAGVWMRTVIRYHQHRNAAARASRIRRRQPDF